MRIRDRISKLIDVKTFITFSITGLFIYLGAQQIISADKKEGGGKDAKTGNGKQEPDGIFLHRSICTQKAFASEDRKGSGF